MYLIIILSFMSFSYIINYTKVSKIGVILDSYVLLSSELVISEYILLTS